MSTFGTVETTYTAAPDRYERAAFRRAGRSGLDLPAISLGLWQKFGRDYPLENQRDIVLRAFDLGVTHFDNADRYGPPHRAAQQNFGRVLGRDLAPYRDEILLSTKAGNPIGPSPYLRGGSRKSLLTSLDHSLRDLNTDYVDLFYHHSPDDNVPLEETAGALVSAVQSGRALYVGVSNYSPDRARDIARMLASAGVPLLVHQPRYSIFDRTIERNGLLEVATQEGFGLIVWSPVAQGLLTDKYLDGRIPTSARAANSTFLSPDSIDETYRERATALNQVARERGQSLAQLAIHWVLRRPEVTSALIGASSVNQLDHNIKALESAAFTDDELALIDQHGVHGTGLGI